jgi:hypothetical protein
MLKVLSVKSGVSAVGNYPDDIDGEIFITMEVAGRHNHVAVFE